jgi:glyoxylase-like metal-dependent hydrolase (beta-lactamase superfamily II)
MYTVRVFSSPEAAFLVNSFIVETPHGLVLVDTQFLTSAARELSATLRAMGKPLLAVVITHPHPDHFNGTAEIAEQWPGIPIYATQATIDTIRETEAAKREAWTPIYGADYPQRTVLPNSPVLSDQAIVVDGLEIHLDDLGAGESADITVVHLPQLSALIASDLLYRDVHPWLAEGRTQQWLEQIEAVKQRYADVKTVYAGHGGTADLAALTKQAAYLTAFRDLIRHTVTDLSAPTAEEKRSIATDLATRYPGYPLQMLIEMNVDGVAKELAVQ